MRVVVVGASGNVGTALLRQLATDATVTSVVGVARRAPSGPVPPPYDVARWVACDVAAPGPDEAVVDALAAAFVGADAVVHLAWAIQPSHDREALARTNVDGTRRVLAAARANGVPHVVVASSVGAYSPVDDDELRDESWPTGGIRTSSYSTDKVAVERLLDEAEALPDAPVIARLRPSLIFQHDAGAEIGRLFLGPWVPRGRLDALPVLPWPTGLRLQAVHADDVARAYREAVVRQARGAFNVAAPGLVTGQHVAALVAEGNLQEVEPAVVRQSLAAAWLARLAPVGPGWLDMALHAPLLDVSRTERELGWRAQRTGFEAVADLVDGLVVQAGTASPALRPGRFLSRLDKDR